MDSAVVRNKILRNKIEGGGAHQIFLDTQQLNYGTSMSSYLSYFGYVAIKARTLL